MGHNTSQWLLCSEYVWPASLVKFDVLTNQRVDQSVFFTELCLEEDVLLADLLHLFFEQSQLLCLQPVHLRTFSLALVLLTCNYGIIVISYITFRVELSLTKK